MANRSRSVITEKTFKAVKIMSAGGAEIKEIAEYLGISYATVTRIRRWDTYEEYRQQQAAIALEYKSRKAKPEVKPQEKPVEEKPVTVAPVTNFMPYKTQAEIIALLKEQNETLKLISAKLVFIVEQLA